MIKSSGDSGEHFSCQAGDFLTSDTVTQPNLSQGPEVSRDQFVEHVMEYNQEMKCTVNEISQLKDRISTLENEIKTLKLFLVFLAKCHN